MSTPGAPELDLADVRSTIARAVAGWSQECGGVTFVEDEPTDAQAATGDGINSIQWVASDWAARGIATDAPGATNVQYTVLPSGDWAITEADIYLNAETFTWSLRPDRSAEGERDLGTVIVHEAGHALGLLHVCEPNGGEGAPDCESEASFEGRTMFPFYSASREELSADDIAGVCFLYPTVRCDGHDAPSVSPGAGCVQDGGAPPEPPETEDAGRPELREAGGGDAGCASESEGGAGDGGITCGATLRALGERCAVDHDCAGSECLGIDGRDPVCTRRCEPANECPTDWTCKGVMGRDVCVPKSALADDGCSINVRNTPGASSALARLCIALALAAASRNRLRTGKART